MQSEENGNWAPESGLDVLLMLLYAEEGEKGRTPVRGITRLDKLMFLLSRLDEFGALFKDDYDFIPYNFGPFATELLDDIEALKSEGLIQVKEESPNSASQTRDAETSDEETGEFPEDEVSWDLYKHETYSLSELGLRIARKIFDDATADQRSAVERVKQHFNGKSLTGLLRYVYRTYPKYASESVIRRKILGGS